MIWTRRGQIDGGVVRPSQWQGSSSGARWQIPVQYTQLMAFSFICSLNVVELCLELAHCLLHSDFHSNFHCHLHSKYIQKIMNKISDSSSMWSGWRRRRWRRRRGDDAAARRDGNWRVILGTIHQFHQVGVNNNSIPNEIPAEQNTKNFIIRASSITPHTLIIIGRVRLHWTAASHGLPYVAFIT